MDDVDDDTSSDTDAACLQIDVSPVSNFNGSLRLRRQSVDDTSFINKKEEEIER